MPLNRVTVTGVDDSVAPEALLSLSMTYPFVEWGILVGTGVEQRFPSAAWIEKVADLAVSDWARIQASPTPKAEFNLSLHCCGTILTALASGFGDSMFEMVPREHLGVFGRIQLNWRGIYQGDIGNHLLESFEKLAPWCPEITFQFDGVNHHLPSAFLRRFNVSALLDASNGSGIAPKVWPHPTGALLCGWAGGLNPDNVSEEIKRIEKIAYPSRPFWVSLETGVRNTEGGFDLEKCTRVLEALSSHVSQVR